MDDNATSDLHPSLAWCRIDVGEHVIVTNSVEDMPDGIAFIAVEDNTGERFAWWPTAILTHDREAARRLLDELARTCANSRVGDVSFGVEDEIGDDTGALRIGADREHIRVVQHGTQYHSAYWVTDEIAEDPAEVLGAALGALAYLR